MTGVSDGLGSTIQAGGDAVRSGLTFGQEAGSGGVETSASDTAKTAQNKLSEGVGDVENKGANASKW